MTTFVNKTSPSKSFCLLTLFRSMFPSYRIYIHYMMGTLIDKGLRSGFPKTKYYYASSVGLFSFQLTSALRLSSPT